MNYNFKEFEAKLKDIEGWLVREFAGIRTGRATVSLLDQVLVEAYGAKSPVAQVATILIEDPKTLRISPWDASLVKAVEKAIMISDIGVSTVTDEKGVRVIFPALTGERRELLIKQANKKLEEARISIRNEREKVWGKIQDEIKNGTLPEDAKFKLKEDMQKFVDAAQKKLEEITTAKEAEIKI